MPSRWLCSITSCVVCMIFPICSHSSVTYQGGACAPTATSVCDPTRSNSDPSQSPALIRYEGILKGKASSAEIALTFSIYSNVDTTNPLWQEVQNVRPDADGHYTVLLGITDPSGVPASILSAPKPQWLGIRVTGQADEQKTLLFTGVQASQFSIRGRVGSQTSNSSLLTAARAQSSRS
jgi:hypothetical protein